MMETMLKTLLKSVDIEKLTAQALADPRVKEGLEALQNIRDDFAAIKKGQADILARLDKLEGKADIHPAQDELFLTELFLKNQTAEKD